MVQERPFRFGVQGRTTGPREAWLAAVRRAEELGYSSWMVLDHFVRGLDPVAALAAAAVADAVTFTSSSTVTNYLEVAGDAAVPPVVACIGPVTAATARDHGLTVTVEAEPHTVDGLVDALLDVLAPPTIDR